MYLGGLLLKGREGRGEEDRKGEERGGEGGSEFVLYARKKKRKVGAYGARSQLEYSFVWYCGCVQSGR